MLNLAEYLAVRLSDNGVRTVDYPQGDTTQATFTVSYHGHTVPFTLHRNDDTVTITVNDVSSTFDYWYLVNADNSLYEAFKLLNATV
jgi:hypothetical protein